ncbi:hypothetical protein P280DRAFT_515029 [Massarina eburnea CBS 473.64]|uniref:Uncharacterized protein n=1 Tax=Massarina eburnea CBS 473.64 TaxID=1395130 RepID=A0A6A6S8M9_9PLEO|nr:hypothetical protein P280DRAFT_515029 [Massarina eburnea CBS 473.64]
MKFISLFMLLCSSTVLASGLDLVPREPKCPKKDGGKDDQTIAHYKKTGQCFSYDGFVNNEKSLAPCSGPDGYCEKVKKSTSGVYGCKLSIPAGTEIKPNDYFKDEDCNTWLPGECMCECELCKTIFEFVAEGLAKLDNVLCAIMISSLKTIIDVGIMFVPGGQASTGIKAAIQGAKSFYENGEEAASFFGNWIGPACGIPEFDFDITQVFMDLINAPDSMSRGESVGCKKKSGCRKLDPVPDPTKNSVAPTNNAVKNLKASDNFTTSAISSHITSSSMAPITTDPPCTITFRGGIWCV